MGGTRRDNGPDPEPEDDHSRRGNAPASTQQPGRCPGVTCRGTHARAAPSVASFLLLLLTLAAAPATKPAKPADTVEFTAAAVKAHFRVPKLWLRRDAPGSDPQVVFLFDPAPKKKPSQVTFQQFVSVYLSPAKPTQTTLADVVADTRAALEKMQPGVKFTKNAAATFAGRPAWTFHWTPRTKVSAATPDGKTTSSYVDMDRIETVWLKHNAVCQVGLIADTRFMPSLIQKAEPVAKSIGWDD